MQRTVLVQRLQTLTEILLPAQVRRPKQGSKFAERAAHSGGESVWPVCFARAEAIASPAQTIPTSNVSEPDKSRYFWCGYA